MSQMIDNQGNTLVNVTESALPSGAATEAKQDTGNTSLASIDTKTPALSGGRVPVDGSGVTQPVSAASLPLPTGAATSAKQDTLQTSVDAVKTAVQLIDDPVATISAVPLMRVAVFDDAGAQVTSFGGGAGGTANTEYAKDTASTATDKQIQAGVVRKDTRASLVDTDGDRTQLQVNASGDLRVDGSAVTQPVSASSLPLPTGAATEATLAGVATDSNLNSKIGSLTETAPTNDTNSSGLNGRLQRIAQRLTSLIGLFPSALTGSGNFKVSLAESTATVTVASHAVTNAGTFAVQAASAGDVAHDGVDSGNPVKVGGKAATSLPTAVAASDRTNLLTDVYGRPFVRTFGPSGSAWTSVHEPATNTQATTTKSAAGAGVRNVCTGITVTFAAGATAPTAVQVAVRLRDGASGSGTVIWAGVLSLPATAGVSVGVARQGLWIPGTANTAMTLEFSAAGGANTIQTVSMEGTTVAE